jgi:hypothetical protein
MSHTKTAQHTPGPWEHDGNGMIYGPPINDDAVLVCDLLPDMSDEMTDEMKANARLIAAAPDLLAALENFVAWHAENFDDFTPEINAQLLCLANNATAAIAKATGGA